MVKILSFLAFCVFTFSTVAQETAYTAMNAVGTARGQKILDHLLAVEGLGGASQPVTWRLVFEDAGSRGGYREIEVQNGRIVSQRAPLKNPFSSNTPMNLDRLQLDSDGAFTVAEGEARRQKITFDSANYFLQTEDNSTTPAWRLELLDRSGRVALSLGISANDGRILGQNSGLDRRNDDYVVQDEPSSGQERVDQDYGTEDSTEGKIHRTLHNTRRSIHNAFKHVGGSLQQVFTGRRTIDKDLPED